MASTSPKRSRFDASAESPSDSATTPMASARQSLKSCVESLHPDIATILSRLGLELLVVFHKLATKQHKVTQFENEASYIPISARCKFTLSCSKLVEQDTEYTNECTRTNHTSYNNTKVNGRTGNCMYDM